MTELQFDPINETPAPDGPRRPRRTIWGVAVLIALASALGLWQYLRSSRPANAPPAAAAAPDTAPTPPVPAPSPAVHSPDLGLPDLGQSDSFVRSLIAELFGSPELDRWLASSEELLRQGVRAVLAVAEQRSARRFLTFLPVEGRFAVDARGAGWIIAPESYRRYDRVVDLFVGLDAREIARFVKRLEPLLSRAMDEEAFPGTDFETTLKSAIEHLSATPLPAEELEVVRGDDGLYNFADPRLEVLSAPQKQLLRLGQRNGARVRAKLAEVEQALAQ